jgi:hypothetical protein
MRIAAFGFGIGLSALAGIAAAEACQGTEILFQDDFTTLEPAWGEPDDAFFGENGKLVITPGLDEFYSALSNAGFYDDIDYCVAVTSTKGDPGGDSFAGLIFWATDYDNYYSVLITSEGSAGVFRRQRGRTLPQVNWQDVASLKQGDNVANEVRVVTKGGEATIYLNGQEFRKIKGQAPKDGQQIGVRATSPKTERAVFAFDDIKVTAPTAPTAN